MISLPIGIVAFVAVIALSAGQVKLLDYFNWHGLVVVFGGTIAVLALGTPTAVLKATARNFIALFKRSPELSDVRDELLKLAHQRSSVKDSQDPLIQYAIDLWERGVDANTFQALISQRRDKLETDDVESVSAIQNLAKYPPALGMTGTVMGMISLFANLGSSNKSALGPALAVAMTATFYGLILANGFLMPLADRIHVEAMNHKKYFGQVYEILTLINHREPAMMVEEEISNREVA